MYYIEKHSFIDRIVGIFYRFGLWQKEDKSFGSKIGGYLLYIFCSFGFTISLILGALATNSKNKSLYLGAGAVSYGVIFVKATNIRLKKETILSLLNEICSHSFTTESEFIRVHQKINKFMNFVTFFVSMICCSSAFAFILIAFTSDKSLPLNIELPSNWRNNKLIYWIAYVYVIISLIYNAAVLLLTIIIWYLMMNYAIKYKMLGNRFRELGINKPTMLKTSKIPSVEKQNSFHRELIELFKDHQSIQKSVDEFKSFFSYLFFVQIVTSSICICGSVYVLSLVTSYETLFQSGIFIFHLLYSFFDIFMLMYLGNEIKLSSNRLSYCLFESNWIQQPKSTKMCTIILAELLQQPHELIIAQLYPLDLGTFNAILRLAYSMFNILRK